MTEEAMLGKRGHGDRLVE